MLELITGAIVAAVVVGLILTPLIRPRHSAPPEVETDFYELEESDSPKVRALLALREIEFDRATGKLSEDDYVALKGRFGRQALQAMENGDEEDVEGEVSGEAEDLAEQAIARFRASSERRCVECGVRPEGSAVFCSACGRSLLESESAARCWMCGTDLPNGARFCGSCGFALSA